MTTPSDATEEARAAAYRQQVTARVQFQESLWMSLAGDPAALDALHNAWQPVVDWMAEQEMPEIDNADEVDPLGISDTVNVGR